MHEDKDIFEGSSVHAQYWLNLCTVNIETLIRFSHLQSHQRKKAAENHFHWGRICQSGDVSAMKTLKMLAAFLLFWLTSFELIFPAASKAFVLSYLIGFILTITAHWANPCINGMSLIILKFEYLKKLYLQLSK